MSCRRDLYKRNIVYFKRYYRLLLWSVVVAVAVIVGSLTVGDSVRGTLRGLVEERLGQTETIIFAQESFLDERIMSDPLFSEAKGYLLVEGFVAHEGRLLPVMVWGTKDESLESGQMLINEPLEKEMGGVPEGEVVLRLPAEGLVPSGSMFVTDTYTTSLRLGVQGVRSAEEGGNVNLRTEQVQPFNVFVPHAALAEAMGVDGRINIVMSERAITEEEWHAVWQKEDSGIEIGRREDGAEITSSRIFLQEQVVQSVLRDNPTANRLYSYLGNSIRSKSGELVYSFVTAMECYRGRELAADEAIVSDYTARRLGLKVGDAVSLSYFKMGDWKNLSTDSVKLRVGQIVPLAELVEDKSLSAEFPGLSDVERCTEWDSDLPLDMDLITDEDEAYWSEYRQTPKMIVPYAAVKDDWSDDYGSATAIRVESEEVDLKALRPEMFGVQVIHPQQQSMAAAENGVDFSSLFLALGFFIITSALLLQFGPLAEMYEQREEQIRTLSTIGFTRREIGRMLWREALPVVAVGAVAGIVGGVIYSGVILWLLEGVWSGATHTSAFRMSVEPLTLTAGVVAGVVLSLGVLAWAIRDAITEKRVAKQRTEGKASAKVWLVLSAVAAVVLYAYAVVGEGSLVAAVVAGLMTMIAAVMWVDYRMVSQRRRDGERARVDEPRLASAALSARRRQIMLSLVTMAFGVFIVFVVGLNRRSFGESANLQGATGGYTLWCESSVPLQHDPSTEDGRERLGLKEEWQAEMEVMPCFRFQADDASCLNLNKVSKPTVLGVDFEQMRGRGFDFGRSIFDGDVIDGLRQSLAEGEYPALVDETVLMWSLGMKLGDRIEYVGQDGTTRTIVLAATLKGSLFHGNVLIDKEFFNQVWPEVNGCSLFLVGTEKEQTAQMKNFISQSLYEYGMRVTEAGVRLRSINEVTDTYLSIFMTLGSVGLLLGLISFVVIIRKNLTRSLTDVRQYLLLGFGRERIERMLYEENVFAARWAIVIGVVGAIVGIGRQWMAVGGWIWIGGVVVVAALWFVAQWFVAAEVKECLGGVDDQFINQKEIV